MLDYFKKAKGRYIQLMQQTTRPLTLEEKEEVMRSIDNAARFPSRVILEMLSKAYTIKDARIKADKIKLIEDIFELYPVQGLIQHLADLLDKPIDVVTKSTVHKLISRLANAEELQSLTLLLKSRDPENRTLGASILNQYAGEEVCRILKNELKKDDWRNKSEALDLLFEFGDEDIVEFCEAILKTGKEPEKRNVVGILTRIGTTEAVELLSEAIPHSSLRLRTIIAQALTEIGTTDTVEALIKLLNDDKAVVVSSVLQGLTRINDSRVIEAISEALSHREFSVQLQAIETLGRLGDEKQVPILINRLKDEDFRIRQAATESLYQIAFKEETNLSKLLLELMVDNEVNVRRCVAELLRKIQDESLFDELFEFLKDEDWWVREAIAETLSKVKDNRVVPSAIKLLESDDEIFRRYGIEILIGIKDRRAVKPILKLLNDPDWWVRERAVEALGFLGNVKIVPLLINLLKIPELRYVATKSLGQIGDKRAVSPLLDIINDSASEIQKVILEALSELNAVEAAEDIKGMLISPEREVRLKAKDVLNYLNIDLGADVEVSDAWWEKRKMGLLDVLLLETKKAGGADLTLVTGLRPFMRVDGELFEMKRNALTEDQIFRLIRPALSHEQEQALNDSLDVDFSYEITGEGRFRGNICKERNGLNVSMRLIPDKVPALEELKVPEIISGFGKKRKGLIIFSGPPACGKTTTMASMINQVNHNRNLNIITIEDPIEYLFENANSVITQREIGSHAISFTSAIDAALREDPDVIMVGEMRDSETIRMTLAAAETGHLVFATLNSVSAPQAIERIIDYFPTKNQDQIRLMLADNLWAVVSQQLLSRKDGSGRHPAFEILMINQAIRNLIREDKLFQVPSHMTTNRSIGMTTMDHSLANLVRQGIVSAEEAYIKAFDKDIFRQYVEIEKKSGNRSWQESTPSSN